MNTKQSKKNQKIHCKIKRFECTNCKSIFDISIVPPCFLNSQSKIDIAVCYLCHFTRTKRETLIDESGNIKSFNKNYSYTLDFLNNYNEKEK